MENSTRNLELAQQSESDASASEIKSNNKPSISLPKGGGAIRGIGEKFAANPVTGTGSMTVPIAVSPGRSGFGPQLSLSYDSGSGNGPFGLGWNLSLPSITRKTDKGLPKYQDADNSDEFILSGAEDLVPVLVQDAHSNWVKEIIPPRKVDDKTFNIQRYRPRIEGLFARIERWTNQVDETDVFWRSISKDNITTWYGRSFNSRVNDPNDATRIFSWLICESHDNKGNVIVYEYSEEDSHNVSTESAHEISRTTESRSANRYLKRIKYGNQVPYFPVLEENKPLTPLPSEWHFTVVFDYDENHYELLTFDPRIPEDEQHQLVRASAKSLMTADSKNVISWSSRPDPFSTYRPGFEVRTYRRCQRVLMFHQFGELGEEPYLVKSTEFNYRDFDYRYDYTLRDELEHKGSTRYLSQIQSVTQSGYVRDYTRDVEEHDGIRYITYIKKSLPPIEFQYSKAVIKENQEVIDEVSLRNLPQGLDGTEYQWVNLDGEGPGGILVEQNGSWYYKRNLSPLPVKDENEQLQVKGRFGPAEPISPLPSLRDVSNGPQQFLDLAGDGQVDVVTFEGQNAGFFERTKNGNWQPHKSFGSMPNVTINDPNLKFVDLTGDGHADIFVTEEDAFTWYPSLAEEGFGPSQKVRKVLDEQKGPKLVFADGTQSIYLSDMSGDGLSDLVRIRNGEVCYWPNLGYCRFGAKVIMDNPPRFDRVHEFDQRRIRLADIDGTGVTDILYLSGEGVAVYFNQSGNRWSNKYLLKHFPATDNTTRVMAVDLLGNGTACLVWSSPSIVNRSKPMRYIDLMGGQKPHLLTKVVNNLGAETHIHYAPSTKFYLQDKQAGKPWITRLHFPVHVVEKVESYDHISRNRFVTRYAYHHGYFDGHEREFRGFAMVEQWDTEEFASLSQSDQLPIGDNINAASHIPPIHTKTWFHTGVYLNRQHVSNYFAGLLDEDDIGEYFRELGLDDDQARALLLPDTVMPDNLTTDEEREACRALKGQMLRQEVYAQDGSERETYPYTVTEQNFTIKQLQPQSKNPHAVFFTHSREVLNFHYERNSYDPRISHQLTLSVDDYGNITESASVAYPRRSPVRGIDGLPVNDEQGQPVVPFPEQQECKSTYSISGFINKDEKDYRYIGVPYETKTFEVHGVAHNLPPSAGLIDNTFFDSVRGGDNYEPFQYEPTPDLSTLKKRLIDWKRHYFRKDESAGSLTVQETIPNKEINLLSSDAEYQYTSVDHPELTRTQFSSVNDSGTISGGGWERGSGKYVSFLYNNGVYEPVNFPEAQWTRTGQVNNHGTVVGWYQKPGENVNAYIKNNDAYESFSYPEAIWTYFRDVNDHNIIVGSYEIRRNPNIGGSFLYYPEEGRVDNINYPGATFTLLYGLNNEGIGTGAYTNKLPVDTGKLTKFQFNANTGEFTELDILGLPNFDFDVSCVNEMGTVVGVTRSDKLEDMGNFIYGLRDGAYSEIRVPGCRWTYNVSLNNAGVVVGEYAENAGYHAFFATPSPTQQVVQDAELSAVEAADNAVWVCWKVQRANGSYDLLLRRREAGSVHWSTAEPIVQDINNITHHDLVVDSAGNLWLFLLEDDNNGSRSLYCHRYDPHTQQWNTAQVVDTNFLSEDFRIVADQQEGLWLFYDDPTSDAVATHNIYYRRYQTAAGWSDAQYLDHQADSHNSQPSACIDSQGQLWLFWATQRIHGTNPDSESYVFYSQWQEANQAWQPEQILHNDLTGCEQPVPALLSDGRMTLITKTTGAVQNILFTQKHLGQSDWEMPTPVTQFDQPVDINFLRNRGLVEDSDGDLWVFWSDNRGSPGGSLSCMVHSRLRASEGQWDSSLNETLNPGDGAGYVCNTVLKTQEGLLNIFWTRDTGSAFDVGYSTFSHGSARLPLGKIDTLGLPYESYNAAFNESLLQAVYENRQQGIDLQQEGGYVQEDDYWWIPSGRQAFLKDHFYLVHRAMDPFGNKSTINYDQYDLLVRSTQDALQNKVTVETKDEQGNDLLALDYRVLQPLMVVDPNKNRTAVAFDALGLVVGTAVMGKYEDNPAQGDLLESTFVTDLTRQQITGFFDNPRRQTAKDFLGKATSRIIYDTDRYYLSSKAFPNDPAMWKPSFAATIARETHVSDSGEDSKHQISLSYSDGLGREIQKKIQAEGGPVETDGPIVDPRWVGSGWTIFNNKGKPVRQFEPFFSDTHDFEFGKEQGVSPILFYDPVGRVVATLHPNHTYEKVLFDSWQQTSWDVNDTLLLQPNTDNDVKDYFVDKKENDRIPKHHYEPSWYAQRINGDKGPHEQKAAQRTGHHAATPTTVYFDSLGRPFLSVANNGKDNGGNDIVYETRTVLDIEGNQRQVIDAKGRTVMRYSYNMIGPNKNQEGGAPNRIHQASMEAGERWMLKDVAGNPMRTWDSRGHTFRTVYDELRRPIEQYVSGQDSELPDQRLRNKTVQVERIEYGESLPFNDTIALNLRTRVYKQYDCAGLVTNSGENPLTSNQEAYDFKGNLLRASRQLCSSYEDIPDWSQNPELDGEIFQSSTRYDALNRSIQQIAPHDITASTIKLDITQATYNDANLLEAIHVWLAQSSEPQNLLDPNTANHPVVKNIDYNAKGQRLLIQYGNNTETRYDYDDSTFRLMKLYTRRGESYDQDCGIEPDRFLPPEVPPPDIPCGIQNLRYVYDPVGNITHIHDLAQPRIYFDNDCIDSSNNYIYDPIYRLTEASGREHKGDERPPGPDNRSREFHMPYPASCNDMQHYVERYRYDEVGNIMEMVHHKGGAIESPGPVQWRRRYQYTTFNNQLRSTSRPGEDPKPEYSDNPAEYYQNVYNHDSHGNMTTVPHLSGMTWDFKDRLLNTTRQVVNDNPPPDGKVPEKTHYVYDSGGQRVRKVTIRQSGNKKDERIYLGGFEIYRKYNGNGQHITLQRETLHIMDDKQSIALIETKILDETGGNEHNNDEVGTPVVRFQINNHLGSSCTELDEQGNVISYEEYHPYGTTAYQAKNKTIKAAAKRYRYSGKERDEENGFYYYGARYYAAWLGRWIAADPAGLLDELNMFVFSRNCPSTLQDRDGRQSVLSDIWAGIKAIPRSLAEPLLVLEDLEFTLKMYIWLKVDPSNPLIPTEFTYSSATAQRLRQNYQQGKSGWDDFRAGWVLATAMPSGGATVLIDNTARVFEEDMNPQEAQSFLTQAATVQTSMTVTAVGLSKASGSGWTGQSAEVSPVEAQKAGNALIQERVAIEQRATEGKTGQARRTALNKTGHKTLAKEIGSDTPVVEGVPQLHAEMQTEGSIVVDQVPCPSCARALTGRGMTSSLRVFVLRDPTRLDVSPRTSAQHAARGKSTAVPQEVMNIPFEPPLVPTASPQEWQGVPYRDTGTWKGVPYR